MKIGRFLLPASHWLLVIWSKSAHVANGFTVSTGRTTPVQVTTKQAMPHSLPRTNPSLQPTFSHTRLPLSLIDHPSSVSSTPAALLALAFSSMMGIQLEKRVQSSGILATLTVAAFLSNLIPAIPLHHAVYDLCWSWILPGSLTLLLLGYQPQQGTTPNTTSSTRGQARQQHPWHITRAVARVAGPFLLAAIGSIVGCGAAFYCATTTTGSTSSRIVSSGRSSSSWFTSINQARAAVSCLCASYVGGSVNLFATAKIIQASPSLLSSLATADLMAMALYFSVLSASLEWTWLKRLFYYYGDDNNHYDDTNSPVDVDGEVDDPVRLKSNTNDSNSTTTMAKISVLPLLLGTTTAIVAMANWIESMVGRWVPGTACGVIAVATPVVRSTLLRYWCGTTGSGGAARRAAAVYSSTAQTLADVFFFLFFAAIGVGVDLRASLELGPACVLVSVVALMVHLVVTVLGSRLLLPCQRWKITLDDVWIASNAAIGGPATAAAFCTRMKHGSSLVVVGRTVAATVWGVVGYAIGTVVGVGLYRFLGGTTLV